MFDEMIGGADKDVYIMEIMGNGDAVTCYFESFEASVPFHEKLTSAIKDSQTFAS